MANLSLREKNILESLFGMETGYVLDFSNNTFQRFVGDSIGIDIYNGPGYEEYCSKANKLRQIWTNEPDMVVGRLLKDLLIYYEDLQMKNNGRLSHYEASRFEEMLLVAQRLLYNQGKLDLPTNNEETLQTLLNDINNALARNEPTLVLDRLHTFATKKLRQVCTDNAIKVVNNRGEYLPLHSLAGMLKNNYQANNVFQSEFTLLAIQNSISLFDKYNAIRNNQSYAHDNDVLDSIEAGFAIKLMANLLSFIQEVEEFRKRKNKNQVNDDFELPF